MGEARPLYKLDHTLTDKEQVVRLKRRLEVERRLRRVAEERAKLADANSKRFHALLIQARVALINREAMKPPVELPPTWESKDGGYSNRSNR